MNYSKIKWSDVSSGPGIRTSIYFSGCTHNCKGCFNPETHDFNAGEKWTKEIEDKIINHIKKNNLSGLNLLGGDPLQQIKDSTLRDFIIRFKKETDKNIWVWTGYTFEDIIDKNTEHCKILELCDVCVDGKYVEELANKKLRFAGSENQRVIDIQKSIQKKQTVLYFKECN